MSFIGKVTRKEKDTGVTLMAKIVTPSKKKFARKMFKVRVKANGLDDFSCCVIDHASTKNRIENSQDMESILDNLDLIYNGVNGTSISYRIVDTSSPGISSYISQDGKIVGRPKFGEQTVTGYLEITVSKNQAQVTSRIKITVKGYTANEVLNGPDLNSAVLWNYIKGGNTAQNTIDSNLLFVKTLKLDNSVSDVNLSYKVTDGTVAYLNSPYDTSRISDTGILTRPAYKDVCKMVNGNDVTIMSTTGKSGAMGRAIRIGNIKLEVTLTLGEASKVVTYNLATLSMYLTCQEVADVVAKKLYIERQGGIKMLYNDAADESFETITAPSEGGTYKLTAFSNAATEMFSDEEMLLDVGDILNVTISNNVKNFNGNADYSNQVALVNGLGGGFVPAAEEGSDIIHHAVMNIDLDAMNKYDESDKKFSIQTTINVSGYSQTGVQAQRGSVTMVKKVRVAVDTSAIA